jgi:hypothetical protein
MAAVGTINFEQALFPQPRVVVEPLVVPETLTQLFAPLAQSTVKVNVNADVTFKKAQQQTQSITRTPDGATIQVQCTTWTKKVETKTITVPKSAFGKVPLRANFLDFNMAIAGWELPQRATEVPRRVAPAPSKPVETTKRVCYNSIPEA